MRIFDFSLRHKIPFWGSLLILATTLAISAALMFRAYEDLKRDLRASSESLGHTLATTVFPALLHDDLWRAFEIIRAPHLEKTTHNPLDVESIFVLSPELKILVATDPKRMPTLADLDSIGPEYKRLADALRDSSPRVAQSFNFVNSDHYFVSTPVAESGRQLGILVISHGKAVFWQRFLDLAGRSALIGALVVAVILPINWYWGRRTAEPLVELARGMAAIVRGQSPAVPPALYPYRDELGQLFESYREAARELNEKALLEQEVLSSERLAAIGRLATGIAHEVNNPLGGMLMALDNLKQRGPLEPYVAKTAALLERGLQQIAETVGALLVEARVTSRPLALHDFADVHTLIEPQTIARQLVLDWQILIPETVALPAGVVRQILINLLLNAVQATASGGRVRVVAKTDGQSLLLTVTNAGPPLSEELRKHLFEPFASHREGGHGLGLWVTYQTVTQLGGSIVADWHKGEVRFTVSLPLEKELN